MDEDTKDELKKQIGFKIRQFRTMKGWSRQQAADKLNLSLAGYGCIERGEIDMSVTRLVEIAEIFEIVLADLLGLNEQAVFNFTGIHNKSKGCYNYQLNSTSDEVKELIFKNDLEKFQLLLQEREKEVKNLREQITQLKEINQLLKENVTSQ